MARNRRPLQSLSKYGANKSIAVNCAEATGRATDLIVTLNGIGLPARVTNGEGHSIADVNALLHWCRMIGQDRHNRRSFPQAGQNPPDQPGIQIFDGPNF